jgi:uncharacterized protein (TIGR00725 family)
MGPGEGALARDCQNAYELGWEIAKSSWVLVTGGRDVGVMDAASRGAREAGGLTVGILPSTDLAGASDFVDIPIVTGVGQARNNINVLSCRLIFACGVGLGTASEICLALKAGRHAILVDPSDEAAAFFRTLDSVSIHIARDVSRAMEVARELLGDPPV